jgi:hypothetical protein
MRLGSQVTMRLAALSALLVFTAAVAARAETDPTLRRVFLADGTALVSYGEFARLDDRIVFSMPVGGSHEHPRFHLVSIPAASVDWPRTDRYTASARYQQYAAMRGEEDFTRLTSEVARVLNEIALGTNPALALQTAMQARKTLVEWPPAHFGYRQSDIREIVGVLDEAVSGLRAAAGIGSFELSIVTSVAAVPLEPLLDMPAPRELFYQILRVAQLTDRSTERVSLLETAVALLDESRDAMPSPDALMLRNAVVQQVREELTTDERYAELTKGALQSATRAAARARVRDVEAVLVSVSREDERLGRRRPEVIQALNASVEAELDAARRLRLLRDRWMLRRSLYREYNRAVASPLLQLVKAQPALDAIKRLDGPELDTLAALQARMAGGAERLQRTAVPVDLRTAHDLLIGSWQFAERALRARREAVSLGNLGTAWEASSAAAGALMLLGRAQNEIRALLEAPQLR